MAMNAELGRDKENCGVFLGVIWLEELRKYTETRSHCSKTSIR
jgi:hypothetical protein